jgi:trans-2,3-dihydro-3-hydroxyanthranilate isomerase
MNFTRYNAFCTAPGCGNPAAVVSLQEAPAQAYPDAALQAIAADMLCETGFVLNPETCKASGVLEMRYFTAARVELKFIGHVTVAALAFLAQGRDLSLTVRSKGGDIPARYTAGPNGPEGGGGVASFEIPFPSDIHPVPAPLALLQAALGPIELDKRAETPVYAFGTSSRLLVFVADLDAVKPDIGKIVELSNHAEVSGVFAVELAADGASTRSRMFCPLIGVSEDACSGNAHGLLGFVLRERGLLPPNGRFVGYQGASIGRPSTVSVTVDPARRTAAVGGSVATFCTGRIAIDN